MCGNVDLLQQIRQINQIIYPNEIEPGKILDIDCSNIKKPAMVKLLQSSIHFNILVFIF